MTSHLTTHVLDASAGKPAAGIEVVLEHKQDAGWTQVATGTTNADGRIGDLGPEQLASGTYRLTFAVADYFAATGTPTFYPEITVTFAVDAGETHYHVPVLLSPFAYSTYRGS